MAAAASDGKDATKAYALLAIPPQTFGKYTLIGKLGHGGMAEVNLAMSEGKGGFRKLVVIKRLHRHLAMEPGFIEMFLDEARLAARLNHPHCVQTNEVGEWDDNHFLAMEYLDGQGLERLLRISGAQDEPIPIDLCVRIVSDALDGLAYAHELTDFDGTPLHVVHRDVSPQNIFVTYNGMVKLLDFGIAKAATHVVETKTGVIKGKYAYIAPEQALGGDVDQRSDLWSMGVVLWEVMTGRRLFKSVNELATLQETLQGEIKLPSAFRPELPTELDTIAMRALARNPHERYQSAVEMKEDLDRFLFGLPKTPNRRHVSRLMRERFSAVISNHKQTLAHCLEGSGAKLSSTSIQRLVDPGESSASGIRTNEPGMTPTPTPTPQHYAPTPTPPPSMTPPPYAMTPPPGAAAQPPPQAPPRDRSGMAIKALLVIAVILLAVIAALILPLGGTDEPETVVQVGNGQVDGPQGQSTESPSDGEGEAGSVDIAPIAMRGAGETGEGETGETAETGEGGTAETGETGEGETGEGETGEGETGESETAETGETGEADEGEETAPSMSAAERRAALARRRARELRREREAREAAERERLAAVERQPPPAAATGRLNFVTTPWTQVSVNGRDLGTTPLINVELPAGRHTLRLVNRAEGINQTFPITIPAGGRVARRVGLER